MASQTRIAGTGANDSSVGTMAWFSPERITADDSSFAFCGTGSNPSPFVSNYLKATNFGFSIPGSATITGIVVTHGDRAVVPGPSSGTDNSIRLVKGGAITGDDKSSGSSWAIDPPEVKTFGSSTDLWGGVWTPDDINSSGFGTVLALTIPANSLAAVDYISITVHYSLPPIEENVDKVVFYSGWDIDKIVDYQNPDTNPNLSITLDANNSTTVTIPHSYGYRPYIIAQYKPSTQSAWFEAGENLQVSSEQLVTMDVWARTSDIRFRVDNFHNSSVDIDIRYWVLSDGN